MTAAATASPAYEPAVSARAAMLPPAAGAPVGAGCDIASASKTPRASQQAKPRTPASAARGVVHEPAQPPNAPHTPTRPAPDRDHTHAAVASLRVTRQASRTVRSAQHLGP